MTKTKNIILAITGGIAAYKSAYFARKLIEDGFDVRVVMTRGAQAFISTLTFQALTGREVHHALLNDTAEAGMGHIELAKWADLIIIAPASANTMARLNQGMADDLLTTLCLATTAPILLAPAMNQQMWAHPATKRNVESLSSIGYHIIAPASGVQACGDVGEGRLPEPEVLLEHVHVFLAREAPTLAGKRVVITAGPTQEPLDPVRYLSNHSTGKMGFALAKACRNAGASVTLVAGTVSLPSPLHIKRVDVQSADDMLAACEQEMSLGCDIFIATAAVADYRTRDAAPQKIKKSQDEMLLDLVKNPDILATIAHQYPQVFTLGFAAETQNVAEYATKKLTNKKLDMIACNDVSRKDIGFGSDDNAMTVYFADGRVPVELAKASKEAIAKQLVKEIVRAMSV